MQTEIIKVERRRRWSFSEKRQIVAETLQAGASVNAVAQRHGLHSSQVFAWRRAFRDGGRLSADRVAFAPVVVGASAVPVPNSDRLDTGRMEILLGNGWRIIVGADVDAEALARVLEVVERR